MIIRSLSSSSVSCNPTTYSQWYVLSEFINDASGSNSICAQVPAGKALDEQLLHPSLRQAYDAAQKKT